MSRPKQNYNKLIFLDFNEDGEKSANVKCNFSPDIINVTCSGAEDAVDDFVIIKSDIFGGSTIIGLYNTTAFEPAQSMRFIMTEKINIDGNYTFKIFLTTTPTTINTDYIGTVVVRFEFIKY